MQALPLATFGEEEAEEGVEPEEEGLEASAPEVKLLTCAESE